MKPALHIERFTVTPHYVVAVTAVRDRAFLHVNECLADAVLRLFPGLASQPCVSKHHDSFGEELLGTETPHLAEHIALELSMLSSPDTDHIYRGMTRFLDVGVHDRARTDGIIRMETSLTYDNDLIALKAFGMSVDLIAALMDDETANKVVEPDVARMVGELSTLRTFG